jgi:putative MATE family efflux protein
LSYRRLHSTTGTPSGGTGAVDVASAASTFNSTDDVVLPLDFDQIQSLDVLNSITQQVVDENELILTEDGQLTSSSTASSVGEFDNTKIVQEDTSGSSKSETHQMETRQMVNEIAAIALPSLGGMLLDPIMSLIDTACVGQVSTTALAAMAPCTSIFQFAFFAFFFLSAATTNLVASNPPESVYDPNNEKEAAKRVDFNERVVSNAAGLAVLLGSIVTFGLVQFSDPLLKLAGIPASNTALLNAARPYLLIRAMGLPFVFLATVLQGSSLGRGNAWRPLKIFGAAGIINLIGDVYLTLFKGWGATGAATATVAAQVGAALYYVISSMRLDKSVKASSQPFRDVSLVWRGLPSKHIIKTFMNVAMVLFSRSIGLMLAFSMLTRTAALGGETALAAHQVTLQVWWLLSFLPEPMSVAAQTLITRDMKDRKFRVPKLVKTLYGMCGVLGLSAAALTGVILRAPAVAGALVADVSVQKMMASLVPFAVLSQSYCPIATLSDGVCIGLGSFSHLPLIMVGSFLTTATGLAFVASQNMGVVGVWACMNLFLSSRITGHLLMSTKLRQYVKKAFGREKKMPEMEAVPIAA